MLELPLKWKTPKRIFVNSMSDLFHVDVPLEYIQQVFATMNRAHWHQYQVLTKRADRLQELSAKLPWSPHIWMGVSVENARYIERIDHLRRTGAHVKFLSLEPLLGPLPKLNLRGIHWVIVGGESGPNARPMDPAWVTDLRNQCHRADVAFFFKQWGGVQKSKTGRDARRPHVGPDARACRHFLMARLVVHCKKEKYDVYIGRAVPRSGLKASIWANPFVIGKDGTRSEVMEKYRTRLMANPELLRKLPELKGKVLGCWCAPEACHGDTLAELANR